MASASSADENFLLMVSRQEFNATAPISRSRMISEVNDKLRGKQVNINGYRE
jgi:hypothetical protein